MINVLLVGMGGFLGSVARYLVGLGMKQLSGQHWLPFGTLTVNVLGCFIIGILGSVILSREIVNEQLQVFLLVGVLGGFTTFSAFGLETVHLIKGTNTAAALINVLLHVTLCITAAWAGHHVMR